MSAEERIRKLEERVAYLEVDNRQLRLRVWKREKLLAAVVCEGLGGRFSLSNRARHAHDAPGAAVRVIEHIDTDGVEIIPLCEHVKR